MTRWLGVLALVGVVAGCGTTTKEGAVGETLDSRTVRATLREYAAKVKKHRGRDVTGFSTPGTGNRFVAVDMELCRDEAGQAVNAFAFELELDGGEKVRPRSPQAVYDDAFDVSREGCERGWIVYAVPADATPARLRFAYDDTGSARPGDREEHVDFSWDL
jgi:hypothetical protein